MIGRGPLVGSDFGEAGLDVSQFDLDLGCEFAEEFFVGELGFGEGWGGLGGLRGHFSDGMVVGRV